MSHVRYHLMPNAKAATADSGGRPLAVLAVQVAALAVSVALVLQLAFGVVGIRYVYGYIPDFAAPTLIVEALRRSTSSIRPIPTLPASRSTSKSSW